MTKNRQDGWIKHDEGACPVSPEVRVGVRLRDGSEAHGQRAGVWRWDGPGHFGDIIAYRAVEPATGKTDGASEMVGALFALCETIEAMGGLVQDGAGLLLVPAEDKDWVGLGQAYLLACRALGREPMINAEEN